MIEKKPQKNSLNRCKFCGWKFPNELLEKINENSDPLFCELCGAEIRYYYINNQENDEIIKNKNEIYLCGSTDKSKSSLWKRIYDIIKKFIIETGRIKIQKGLTEKQKESITRVFNDNDFPKIFKENFIIVFARITYFELKKLESTANLKNSRRNLTEAELKTLNEHLNPITKKDIKAEFLKNLHKISQNDFRKWLKKLQVKLKLSPTYYNDFITYIQWLIKTIATIISEMWDKTNLPKFEQTILKDLKNYFYSFYFTKNNIKIESEDQKLRRLKETTNNGINLDKNSSFNLNGEIPVRSPNNEESEAVNTFTILELFENLKRELEKIDSPEILARGGLSDSMLGTLLGKSENHINYIKSQIRNYKLKGEVYQLALDLLDHYKESLKSKFGEKAKNAINFIGKYRNLNFVRKSLKRIHSHHPNLILDYFKIVNNKEKAYWLGFIFADGFIEVNGKRFAIELGRKDKRLLYKLAKCLKFNEDYIFYNKEHNSYVLRFQSEEFCNYLVNLGMIPGETKSKKIKLPKLDNQELYLAFLLGYFDGDGHQGTSRITSGSIKFLRQIKNRFNIKYSIDYRRSTLTLGASLLNEMLDNYKDSLLRKRIYLRVNVKAEVIDNLGIQIGEIFYTVERLSKLLWEMPLYKLTEIISQESGVEMSDRTLAKYCDKLNLHRPNSGYWHQKKFLGKFG